MNSQQQDKPVHKMAGNSNNDDNNYSKLIFNKRMFISVDETAHTTVLKQDRKTRRYSEKPQPSFNFIEIQETPLLAMRRARSQGLFRRGGSVELLNEIDFEPRDFGLPVVSAKPKLKADFEFEEIKLMTRNPIEDMDR